MGSRIYEVILPRGYTFPAICFHVANNTPDYDVSGTTGHESATIQIDCYGASASSSHSVSEAVKAVLKNYSTGSSVEGCFLERDMDMPFQSGGDTKGITFRVLLQFRLEYAS